MKKFLLTSLIIISPFVSSLFALDIYNQCAGCHGEKGEKVALGRSIVINQMTKDEIVAALQGYKTN